MAARACGSRSIGSTRARTPSGHAHRRAAIVEIGDNHEVSSTPLGQHPLDPIPQLEHPLQRVRLGRDSSSAAMSAEDAGGAVVLQPQFDRVRRWCFLRKLKQQNGAVPGRRRRPDRSSFHGFERVGAATDELPFDRFGAL